MERSPEIEAVVRRLWKAFVDQDRQALANMTTDNPDLRAILNADDEWIRGNGRFEDVLVDRAKLLGVVGVEFDRLEAFEHGDAGWFAAIVVVARDTGESLTFRNTGIFIIEAGVWRVTQIHTSRGVPNTDTFGYEISQGLASLVGSLDEQAVASVVSVSMNGTVTLMFTDIEGSTRMSEELGDVMWSDLISDHFASLNDAAGSFGGTVIKTLGDGAMIAFPAAREALSAAIDVQKASAESNLRVRIGIHTGDAVQTAGDYAGIAVNKAARITSAAEGGEILASSVTAELAGDRQFRFGPERTAELKGLSGTHRLVPINWQSATPG
jgi:class 3 adenylate cyclase